MCYDNNGMTQKQAMLVLFIKMPSGLKSSVKIGSTLSSGEEILLISGRGLHLLKYLGMSNEGKKVGYLYASARDV